MKRKSLKSQHGRYLLVFTMRRALAVVQWWCPATSWHTDGGKNRRNISAEIYNAVKMSLFPFPLQGDGGEQHCSSRAARRTAAWM